MSRNQAPVGAHLVGTIPLDSSAAVFELVGKRLGGFLRRIPDGETGDRQLWVVFQLQVLSARPEWEVIENALPGWEGEVSAHAPVARRHRTKRRQFSRPRLRERRLRIIRGVPFDAGAAEDRGKRPISSRSSDTPRECDDVDAIRSELRRVAGGVHDRDPR